MTRPAPLIDKRTHADLVRQLRQFIERYTDISLPPESELELGSGDLGNALVHIFARMAELVIDRINQVPEKNFLAFLDLLGLELKPPQAARVPLTFNLIATSGSDTVVPTRTKVAAKLNEGEDETIVFETSRDLVATRSRLSAVFCRDPKLDRYQNNTAIAINPAQPSSFDLFTGDELIPHVLYFSQREYFSLNDRKNIRLFFQLGDANAEWLSRLAWQYWDGQQWSMLAQPGAAQTTGTDGEWQIILRDIPALQESAVNEVNGVWVKAALGVSLESAAVLGEYAEAGYYPRIKPSVLAIQDEILPENELIYPFGEEDRDQVNNFYIGSDLAFAKPGANVQITINTVEELTSENYSANLAVQWQYWDGQSWQDLGVSTPNGDIPPLNPNENIHFTDGTRALRDSGTVSFTVPVAWHPVTIAGREHYWIRLNVRSGNYGSGLLYNPPQISSIDIDYRWLMPQLHGVQSQIQIENNEGVVADRTYSNQIAIDASKTFYPFGEHPKLGDVFYFQCDPVFSDKPNASVILRIEFDEILAAPSSDLVLQWQYWDGDQQAWQSLNVNDRTNNLVDSGEVRFNRPESMQANTVNGHFGYWIRVYLNRGDYGRPTDYVWDSGDNQYEPVPATLSPPIIHRFNISYQYTSNRSELDQVFSENDFVFKDFKNQTGMPFNALEDQEPTIYLGFQRDGDEQGFDNNVNSLYFNTADIYLDSSRIQAQELGQKVVLAWEYWNGVSWVELAVEDETDSLTTSGMIHFIGPRDFRSSHQFGLSAFWLRARWVSGVYMYRPKLHCVLTNTVWSENSATRENEVIGSSTGKPNQVFYSSQVPIISNSMVEVLEPERPLTQEWLQLIEEEGEDVVQTESDADGNVVAITVRWHQVSDFFQSGPRSRHYVLDRINGEIRFGDGRQGLIPPVGRANIKLARYQSGGGIKGNRDSNTITQLKSAIPLITSVTNWVPSRGGTDQETLDSIKTRGPKTLRHRNRAVAVSDYEDLAFEVSNDLARAKGIAARDEDQAGVVGLVVVPSSEESRPEPSVELLQKIKAYMQSRLPSTVDIWVSGPQWLEVNVEVEIVPRTVAETSQAKSDVMDQLVTFLHPLTGGSDGEGWAFGRKPHRSDIYAALERIASVDHIRRLVVHEQGEVEQEKFLIYSGIHRVTLLGQNSRRSVIPQYDTSGVN